jgi:hypothetical protein
MPDKFTGKVGDYIDSWLKQFETWFHQREMTEGTMYAHFEKSANINGTCGPHSSLNSQDTFFNVVRPSHLYRCANSSDKADDSMNNMYTKIFWEVGQAFL